MVCHPHHHVICHPCLLPLLSSVTLILVCCPCPHPPHLHHLLPSSLSLDPPSCWSLSCCVLAPPRFTFRLPCQFLPLASAPVCMCQSILLILYIYSTCNKHSTYLWTDHLLYIEGHLLNHACLFSSHVIFLFLSLFTTMVRYSTHLLLLYSITNYTLVYRHSFVIRYSTTSYSNVETLICYYFLLLTLGLHVSRL